MDVRRGTEFSRYPRSVEELARLAVLVLRNPLFRARTVFVCRNGKLGWRADEKRERHKAILAHYAFNGSTIYVKHRASCFDKGDKLLDDIDKWAHVATDDDGDFTLFASSSSSSSGPVRKRRKRV